jgi:hypothetical protein
MCFYYLANYVIPDVDLLVNDELIVLQQAKPFWVALFHLQNQKKTSFQNKLKLVLRCSPFGYFSNLDTAFSPVEKS